SLYIWSCGCATGEEPYSIAILLDQLKKGYLKFLDYKIIASDIDKNAIEHAKKGLYDEYALHKTPKEYKEIYFSKHDTPTGSKYLISNEIKEKVEFYNEDLIKTNNKVNKFNVIFCRNLFLYINTESRTKLMRILEKNLKPDGFLFLGKTESLMSIKHNFKLVDVSNRIFIRSNYNRNDVVSNIDKIVEKKHLPKRKEEIIQRQINENSKKDIKPKVQNIKDNKDSFRESKTNQYYRERLIEQKKPNAQDLERREKNIKIQENQIYLELQELKKKEKRLFLREKFLEQQEELIKKIKLREKELYLREKQLKQRIESINQYDYSKSKSELILPVGHFVLLNSYDECVKYRRFSIYGLGSGIALILRDNINKIYGISHIEFPNSNDREMGIDLRFPHRFVDTSVNDLFNQLIYNGANKKHLRAIIIGGAKIFNDLNSPHQKNIDAIRKELKNLNIIIEQEDLGGLSERHIIFDTIDNSIYIKKSWESDFRKIRL
ncbi:MAG: hypothetical protein KGD57_09660, partial [Candidatus Lokiarchaeota archaeon]|nr:hypothetical protein [Candidatus Lokiarchaeota archaeon]